VGKAWIAPLAATEANCTQVLLYSSIRDYCNSSYSSLIDNLGGAVHTLTIKSSIHSIAKMAQK